MFTLRQSTRSLASPLLYRASRASAAIISEQARNVGTGNEEALDAMHQIKQEAFRMKESLLRGDFGMLHDVLRSSWDAKKRMASKIVSDRIEGLYRQALSAGAYCARLSGAGGGGFMMFLTDPVSKSRLTEAFCSSESGGIIYGCHFTHVGAQAGRVR